MAPKTYAIILFKVYWCGLLPSSGSLLNIPSPPVFFPLLVKVSLGRGVERSTIDN